MCLLQIQHLDYLVVLISSLGLTFLSVNYVRTGGWDLLEHLLLWKLNLVGFSEAEQVNLYVTTFHSFMSSCDDILKKFWEIEESPLAKPALTLKECTVVKHFDTHHYRADDRSFVVPLPKRSGCKSYGESRSQAIRHFLSLERSLTQRNKFHEFQTVMKDYLELGHAEPVPSKDMDKPPAEESSTTTKVRAVFDASAKSSTGVSLNDTLIIGPTIHPPLIDVLLRFRSHCIALTADVSKMYRAIKLIEEDRNLHCFVWRSSPNDKIQDYRMTRVMFGVAASSFTSNMAVKQNALDFSHEYPMAAKTVETSFYVDDFLTSADDMDTTIILQRELCDLFICGGFLLRKWNSSDDQVLQHIPPNLLESTNVHAISDINTYTKTLGLERNTVTDTF